MSKKTLKDGQKVNDEIYQLALKITDDMPTGIKPEVLLAALGVIAGSVIVGVYPASGRLTVQETWITAFRQQIAQLSDGGCVSIN